MSATAQANAKRHQRTIQARQISVGLMVTGAAGARLGDAPLILELFAEIGFERRFRWITAGIDAANKRLPKVLSVGRSGAAPPAGVLADTVFTNIADSLSTLEPPPCRWLSL